ncbi:hypothetical protein BaRGS_00013938 [Batillaria attramentaria]|uniref:Uncharacterized protein n=1 Tax=Batillaria attramentaria TaxID=370345 RepID=A0ABD0L6E2_9CAEN
MGRTGPGSRAMLHPVDGDKAVEGSHLPCHQFSTLLLIMSSTGSGMVVVSVGEGYNRVRVETEVTMMTFGCFSGDRGHHDDVWLFQWRQVTVMESAEESMESEVVTMTFGCLEAEVTVRTFGCLSGGEGRHD